jgi:hypothetical protein
MDGADDAGTTLRSDRERMMISFSLLPGGRMASFGALSIIGFWRPAVVFRTLGM